MISVCMATYNGEKFIREQLFSILSQIGPDDEVIISDDGSTDTTVNCINGLNDERINLVYNSGIRGYTNNFENAMSYANGDYIFLSDQDDVWLNNKVEITMEALQAYDFVISDAITVDAELNEISKSRFVDYGIKKGFANNLIKTRYIGCCMAFSNKVLKSLFPFPKNSDFCPHDLWVALIAEYYYKCNLINIPLILYRRHGNNSSCGGSSKGKSFYHKCLRRIYCLILVMRQGRFFKN